MSKNNHTTIAHFDSVFSVVRDSEVNTYHSNTKTLIQTCKGTNKIVLEYSNLEFLAIMERYKILDKFGPNKAIARTYKGTDSSLEDLYPEFQILKALGKYSSKIHSSKDIDEIGK